MPLYEYRCPSCGVQFELLTSWSQADSQRCPECRQRVQRLMSSFASSGSCEAVGGG